MNGIKAPRTKAKSAPQSIARLGDGPSLSFIYCSNCIKMIHRLDMSETTDDLEIYSDLVELHEQEKLTNALIRISSCKLEEFTDEQHMINYMKKIAKNLLKELYD